MPRRDDARRRHPALRRTRALLWCQLAAAVVGTAATATALSLGGPTVTVGGWWPALGPVAAAAAAAALLVYLRRADRPRRAVLIALLLLPVLIYTPVSFVGVLGGGTGGTGIRSGGFGWFAYTGSPATMRLIEIMMQLLTVRIWATMLANLVAVANAVLLMLPASREAFRPAAQPDRPDA